MRYLAESERNDQAEAVVLVSPFPHPSRLAFDPSVSAKFALVLAALGLCFCASVGAQVSFGLQPSRAIDLTTVRTPVTREASSDTAVTPSKNVAAAPYLVVTTNLESSPSAANCTPQTKPGTGTDAACTLADALFYASENGGGAISFSSQVFKASNTAAENTISVLVAPVYLPVPLVIPANTSITGPTTVKDGAVQNLVMITGAFQTIEANGTIIFQVNSGSSGVTLSNLNLSGGESGITNAGTVTMSGCLITGNHAIYGGGGIYNAGTMTGTNTTIASNQATPYYSQYGPYDGGPGGDIYNSGGLTVVDSTISGNTAGSNIAGSGNATGGGIANFGILKVINSTLSGNASVATAGQGQLSPSLLAAREAGSPMKALGR